MMSLQVGLAPVLPYTKQGASHLKMLATMRGKRSHHELEEGRHADNPCRSRPEAGGAKQAPGVLRAQPRRQLTVKSLTMANCFHSLYLSC